MHVSPILSQSIERMYQGKQSAYMLFYRKKSLRRPEEGEEEVVRGGCVRACVRCVCMVCMYGMCVYGSDVSAYKHIVISCKANNSLLSTLRCS